MASPPLQGAPTVEAPQTYPPRGRSPDPGKFPCSQGRCFPRGVGGRLHPTGGCTPSPRQVRTGREEPMEGDPRNSLDCPAQPAPQVTWSCGGGGQHYPHGDGLGCPPWIREKEESGQKGQATSAVPTATHTHTHTRQHRAAVWGAGRTWVGEGAERAKRGEQGEVPGDNGQLSQPSPAIGLGHGWGSWGSPPGLG